MDRENLLRWGLIGEREILMAKAQEMGVAFVDLDRIRIEPNAIRAGNRELATKYRALPVKLDMPTLYIAVSDANCPAIDGYRTHTGFRIVPALAIPSEIDAAIDLYYPETQP
jgi:type IV pilus assembly protein PilB